jgi:hypothetical protein
MSMKSARYCDGFSRILSTYFSNNPSITFRENYFSGFRSDSHRQLDERTYSHDEANKRTFAAFLSEHDKRSQKRPHSPVSLLDCAFLCNTVNKLSNLNHLYISLHISDTYLYLRGHAIA